MGDVIPMTAGRSERSSLRQLEAVLLRRIIGERAVQFDRGESDKVADILNKRIGDHADYSGKHIRAICQDIWPNENEPNPAKRRDDLKRVKTAGKLMDYAERIARAVGENADNLLLEAFRGTRFDQAAGDRMAGRDGGPDMEDCWRVVSETLQKLAQEVARAERLDLHQSRLAKVAGTYDLAHDVMRAGSGPLLCGPLAHESVYNEEYPPIPSVILFREPKSASVPCPLIVDGSSEARPVQVTVLREVRLAIGPADNLAEPKALFEFRSVLDLVGPDGPVRILRPWHDLADHALTVEVGGEWRSSEIALPRAPVTDGHFLEWFPGFPTLRFPALLEAPLQFEHHDIVWRPVTAATCCDLLSRGADEVSPSWPSSGRPYGDGTMVCPPRSLGFSLERALHDGGSEGLAPRLRAEARRMVAMVQCWHAARSGQAEDAHRQLRATWEAWS